MLADDEALVEGAFTFPTFRGLGVMADGMGQLLSRARRQGVRSVLTYVAEDNLASLRGCARVGFSLDHLRVNRRRLGRRSSVVSPPDEPACAAWTDPPVEPQSTARGEDILDRRVLVAQVVDVDEMRRVARKPGDRPLVVDHAHRDSTSTEAAHDPESLIVAAADDSPG